MKNIALVGLFLLVLVSCNQSQKIGFVENTKLINEYQEKIDIEAKFKTKIEAFEKRADSTGQAFQKEAQAFQQKAQSMAQEEAQAQYQALSQKQQMLQQRIQMEEQQIQKESQEAVDSLIEKVRKYVKDYGKKNGYTYILGSNEGGSVMYGDESKDITSTILDLINTEYKNK